MPIYFHLGHIAGLGEKALAMQSATLGLEDFHFDGLVVEHHPAGKSCIQHFLDREAEMLKCVLEEGDPQQIRGLVAYGVAIRRAVQQKGYASLPCAQIDEEVQKKLRSIADFEGTQTNELPPTWLGEILQQGRLPRKGEAKANGKGV